MESLFSGVADEAIGGAITGLGLTIIFTLIWLIAKLPSFLKNLPAKIHSLSKEELSGVTQALLLSVSAFLLGLSIFIDGNTKGSYYSNRLLYSPEYYNFLGFFIFSVSIYITFILFQSKKTQLPFLLIAIGILFNPFIPLDISRNGILQFLSALVFSWLAYKEGQLENTQRGTSKLFGASKKDGWRSVHFALIAFGIFIIFLLLQFFSANGYKDF